MKAVPSLSISLRLLLIITSLFSQARAHAEDGFVREDHSVIKAILPGDFNQDNAVDLQDYVVLKTSLMNGSLVADLNSDGEVGLADFNIFKNNFGISNHVNANFKFKQLADIQSGQSAIVQAPDGSGFMFAYKDPSTQQISYMSPGLGVVVNNTAVNPNEHGRDGWNNVYKILVDNNYQWARHLASHGINSIKLYLAAENPTDEKLAELAQDIQNIYRETGIRTLVLSFAGLYADNNAGTHYMNAPTPENLDVVRSYIRKAAQALSQTGPALLGFQISNENAYHVQGAYANPSIYFGGANWNTIRMTPLEYYRFMVELANEYRQYDPNHPLIFGHGNLQDHQIQTMRQAGIRDAFDAISLNLYPGSIVGAHSIDESIERLVEAYANDMREAAELGLPVILGEFGKSSYQIGEDKQAEFIERATLALSGFMARGNHNSTTHPHALAGLYYHELFQENWKRIEQGEGQDQTSLYNRVSDNDHVAKSAFFALSRLYSQQQSLYEEWI